jgi:ABC-type phosphate transport system substrate-binding protein
MTGNKRGRPTHKRLVAAAAGALGALAFAAPGVDAAFTTGKCQGANIVGSGATFQNSSHRDLWATTGPASAFRAYCGAGVTPPGVNWNPGSLNGSGFGKQIMGWRNSTSGGGNTEDNTSGNLSRSPLGGQRFAGTDEPLSGGELAQINGGTDATGDEGQIHQLPISMGAVAVLVNLPDGCTGFYDNAATTSDHGNVARQRIRLTAQQIETAFRGGSDWDDLVPSITGTTTGGAPCATLPVRRVVRQDHSGTTHAFKDFLRAIAPDFGWLSAQYATPNTNWPSQGTLVVPGSSGGGQLVTAASNNDGTISYSELGTARTSSSSVFVRGTDPADDKYWVQVGTHGTFRDPASHPDGFTSALTPQRGANCVGATVSGVPTGPNPTLGLWTDATAVNSASVYGICTLT